MRRLIVAAGLVLFSLVSAQADFGRSATSLSSCLSARAAVSMSHRA